MEAKPSYQETAINTEDQRSKSQRPGGRLLYALGTLFFALAGCYIALAAATGWFSARDRFLTADGVVDHTLIMPTRTPTPVLPTPVYVQAGAQRVAWPDVTSGRAAPVRIRVPAIGIDRAIIQLQQIRNPRTGAWTRDVDQLFRRGRQDLVGHWGGSAYPGGEGNMVLAGHNYSYTGSGVFLHLGRLRPGDDVEVVDKEGQTFVYRVSHVERIPWQRRNSAELERHSDLLYPGGPERLTLVTCSGGSSAPFAQRIYVVAVPAPK